MGIAIVLAVAALGPTGCLFLNIPAPMRPAEAVTADAAYVYGRFHKDVAARGLLPRLLLHYESADRQHDFEIELSTADRVSAIRIAPGKYQLTQVILARLGTTLERDVARVPVNDDSECRGFQAFSAEPGAVLYLGDFFGAEERPLGVTETIWTENGRRNVTVAFTGKLQSVEDRFDATTAELRSLFPAFSAVATRPEWHHTR